MAPTISTTWPNTNQQATNTTTEPDHIVSSVSGTTTTSTSSIWRTTNQQAANTTNETNNIARARRRTLQANKTKQKKNKSANWSNGIAAINSAMTDFAIAADVGANAVTSGGDEVGEIISIARAGSGMMANIGTSTVTTNNNVDNNNSSRLFEPIRRVTAF
jgi:hypothetical protein